MLALLVPLGIFIAATPIEKTDSLKPPDKDPIPVAFLISDGAVVIDFCGPWEVFQDVMIPRRQDMPFRLYTVAETKKPIPLPAACRLFQITRSLTHRRRE
jgi:hypothetical protein